MNSVNEYIEKNIELIDTDLTGFFIKVYTDGITSMILEIIINTLYKADINSHNDRCRAMHYILSRSFEDFQGETTELRQWIRRQLINDFGFPINQIEEYIIANKTEFESDYIQIDKAVSGKWMVYVNE